MQIPTFAAGERLQHLELFDLWYILVSAINRESDEH
jgi:hypothetical protein